MYQQDKFVEILLKCQGNLSLNEYSKITGVDVGYLSRIINKKKNNPPSPKILQKIALHSNGITNYYELMYICGYITDDGITHIHQSLVNTDSEFLTVPIFINGNGKLQITNEDIVLPFKWDQRNQYFAYMINDNSMLPLLGIDDIAIIEKTNSYENGNTCLLSLDNQLLIRKIIDFSDYIELHTAFPYSQPLKLTKEEMKKKNLKILGKVIRAENSSAFK